MQHRRFTARGMAALAELVSYFGLRFWRAGCAVRRSRRRPAAGTIQAYGIARRSVST
jgi:hypothetical protein